MIFNALPLLATATLFSFVSVGVSAGGASGEPNGGSMVVVRFGELDILNGGSGSLVAHEVGDSEDLWHSPANSTCRVEGWMYYNGTVVCPCLVTRLLVYLLHVQISHSMAMYIR